MDILGQAHHYNAMAGYSKRSLAEKLGIKQGLAVAFIGAPKEYRAALGDLLKRVSVEDADRGFLDFIHLFSKQRQDVESNLPKLKQRLRPNGMLWISWPKGSSGVKTDLNENVIREIGLRSGLVDIKVCAVDETWSGLKFVYRRKDRP